MHGSTHVATIDMCLSLNSVNAESRDYDMSGDPPISHQKMGAYYCASGVKGLPDAEMCAW
jgi:hypothetical protein